MHSKIVLNKNSQKLSLSVSSCLVPLPFYTSLIYEILSEDFANNFSVFGGFSPNLWYNWRRKNSKRSFFFWSPTSLYQFALRIQRINKNQGECSRFYLVTFEENHAKLLYMLWWCRLSLDTNSRAFEDCTIYQLQYQKDSLTFFSLGHDGSC